MIHGKNCYSLLLSWKKKIIMIIKYNPYGTAVHINGGGCCTIIIIIIIVTIFTALWPLFKSLLTIWFSILIVIIITILWSLLQFVRPFDCRQFNIILWPTTCKCILVNRPFTILIFIIVKIVPELSVSRRDGHFCYASDDKNRLK